MSIIKIGGSIAAVALVGLSLAACSSAPADKQEAKESTKVETTEEITTDDNGMWEAGVRVGVRHGFTSEGEEATDMACEGFAMMGVTDAASVVSLLEEMAAESGQSIEEALEIPADSLPEGVSVDEALAVAGDEIVEICAL